jgi:hypothetical protein
MSYNVRYWHKADMAMTLSKCPLLGAKRTSHSADQCPLSGGKTGITRTRLNLRPKSKADIGPSPPDTEPGRASV